MALAEMYLVSSRETIKVGDILVLMSRNYIILILYRPPFTSWDKCSILEYVLIMENKFCMTYGTSLVLNNLSELIFGQSILLDNLVHGSLFDVCRSITRLLQQLNMLLMWGYGDVPLY